MTILTRERVKANASGEEARIIFDMLIMLIP